VLVALAAGALFAEELDYGRHHALLLAGRPEAWSAIQPALHNRAVGTGHQVVDYLKQAANVGLALWLVLVPALGAAAGRAPGSGRGGGLRRLRGLGVRAPSPWYAATVGVYVATSQVVHALQGAAERRGVGWRPLDGNVSEFGELVVYYVVALYAYETLRRPSAATGRPAAVASTPFDAGPRRESGAAPDRRAAAPPRPRPCRAA
jgi:hypothetical protein